MNEMLAMLRQEDHLSTSAITTYLRCPQQYYFSYVKKKPITFKSSSLVFGSAVHEALAHFYLGLKNKASDKTLEKEVLDIFSLSWKKKQTCDLPVIFQEKDSYESLQEKGLAMLRSFFKDVERPYKVVAVEEPFSVEFEELSGVIDKRFIGSLDAVIKNRDGSYSILEHKTSSKRYSDHKLLFDLQVTAYHLIAKLIGFSPLKDVKLQLLLKTKNSDFQSYYLNRFNKDYSDFFSIIKGVISAINASAFYPVRDWHCNGCSFNSICVAS